MTVWFSSDHHLGHANILKYSNRPFSSIEEMDSILIDRWNEVVKPEDTVYYLGDLSLNRYWNTVLVNYISKLNGNIILIPGSHDTWLNDTERNFQFMGSNRFFIEKPILSVENILPKVNGFSVPIVLCHYSLRSWDRSHYGSWHLFGHHHGNLEPYGMSFDIGVDCWDFYPVSFEQVREKMFTLKPIVDYSKK